MTEQRGVEAFQIARARRVHFLQHVRMAADRPLTEDDEVAREDVGALDRDRDGQLLVNAPQEVVGTEADSLAAEDVHRVVDYGAPALGEVVLDDRRDHRGFFAEVHRARGHGARRVHRVQVAADAGERFLDAFEFSDRRLELVAHASIGAGRTRGELGVARPRGGQGDRAARGEALHQHPPALARHLRPADDPVEGHEHVLAPVRPILEHRVQGVVAAADVDARRVGAHERAGDSDVFLVPEQMVRVLQPESKPEQRRDGAQRDVTLFPGDAHAQHFAAFPRSPAHDAEIWNRRSVGTGMRIRQAEAGNFEALCEARQVMIFLLLGAVVQQQLGGPQGIGHHDVHRCRAAPRRELLDHLRMHGRGELLAAVFLRDDHPEEALVFDELPRVRRQVLVDLRRLPVVHHRAQLPGLVVEKRLLLRRELRLRQREQFAPVGAAGEKIAVPPHRARVDRFLLGLGHGGKLAAVPGEKGARNEQPAQR